MLDLAARHAVDAHGHEDGPELREGLRTATTEIWESPTAAGAFVQVIEFATDHIEEWPPIQERLLKALGPDRPMRWSVLTADRNRAGTYVALVEFPSYEAATANSADAATGTWFTELSALCTRAPAFRDLDVRRVRPY